MSNIARWDGEGWVALAPGMANPPAHALTVYHDQLIAGGQFSGAGGASCNNIAAWDGNGWRALGQGLTLALPAFSIPVSALAVYKDDLIVGGAFTMAGGQPNRAIAAWDGKAWRAIAGSITGPGPFAVVNALTTPGGSLVVGGLFTSIEGAASTNVARWDGQTWHAMGAGLSGDPGKYLASVHSLGTCNGQLFAGGNFLIPRGIARWDGFQWHDVGGGIAGGELPAVRALAELPAGLAVGGSLGSVGAVLTRNVGLWDGVSWVEPVSGLATPVSDVLIEGEVEIVAGSARPDPWGPSMAQVRQRKGDRWAPVGPTLGGRANTLAWFGSQLVAGGFILSSGGQALGQVIRWNGTTWQGMGQDVNREVYDLAVYGGELVTSAGVGLSSRQVARWDGHDWALLGGGISSTVFVLCPHAGDLYAGGFFDDAGGVPVRNIARWDGSTWHAVGEDLTYSVRAIASHQGELVAGGGCVSAPCDPALIAARWNGTTWLPLSAGILNPEQAHVHPLVSINSTLYAGGIYTAQGGGICYWDGSAWRPLGGGTFVGSNPGGAANAIVNDGEAIVIGGWFDGAGATRSANIARWGCPLAPCYPNCDESTGQGGKPTLDVNDYICFQTKFAIGDPYADCDGNGMRNVNDYICFQTEFALGCP